MSCRRINGQGSGRPLRSIATLVANTHGVGITVLVASPEGGVEKLTIMPDGAMVRPQSPDDPWRTRSSDYDSALLKAQAAARTERILAALEAAAGEVLDDLRSIEDDFDGRLGKLKRWQRNLVKTMALVMPRMLSWGLEKRDARAKAIGIIEDIYSAYDGEKLPSVRELRTFLRDLDLYAQFNGRNYQELAARFGLTSEMRVRQIVGERRREERRKRLPAPEEV